ncbi:hypothetical protein G293_02190 [Candidatus Liberibacter africanus PTSAPSY]|uniref:Uncharacterized protein n=1 Tax=Candidatus Liberibacter africanus PTSAPSY TaxID=1277257 RepID=A0A0G3I4B3_LIBAF|nr:hypothetical protein G293_02190 [Candidatus Liberibacter africanus PTSAPSY]
MYSIDNPKGTPLNINFKILYVRFKVIHKPIQTPKYTNHLKIIPKRPKPSKAKKSKRHCGNFVAVFWTTEKEGGKKRGGFIYINPPLAPKPPCLGGCFTN